MKRLLLAVVLVCAPFVLAEDAKVTTKVEAASASEIPQVKKPYVLTVKERLARIEYIDVTSEKKLIEDETTALEPKLEAILAEAEKEAKE